MSAVVHCKKAAHDVYIGRPGPWGNPFSIGMDPLKAMRILDAAKGSHRYQIAFDGPLDREKVIECYRHWLRDQPALIERARRELQGKVLGCWCAPQACHGDVLARVAEGGEP